MNPPRENPDPPAPYVLPENTRPTERFLLPGDWRIEDKGMVGTFQITLIGPSDISPAARHELRRQWAAMYLAASPYAFPEYMP